jgi:hypothetical protein
MSKLQGVSTPGTSNQRDSPCKGVRSAVVTRVEYTYKAGPLHRRMSNNADLFPHVQPSHHSVDRPVQGRINLRLRNLIEMSLFDFFLLR